MTTKKPRPSTYTPRPVVDAELHPKVVERVSMIVGVLSGELSVSEAARRLDLSRNHFQSLFHRGLGAMIEEVTPGVGGRPPKDATVTELEKENAQLRAEVDSLTKQLDVSRMATLNLADMVRAQSKIGRSRAPRTKSPKKAETTSEDNGEDSRRGLLREARRMKDGGVPEELAATSVATPASTLRRWRARERKGQALAERRGPRPRQVIDGNATVAAERLVRKVHGHIGAAPLAKATGISRRTAAGVLAQTKTAMERERKAGSTHVEVTAAGVVRSFDQMYVRTLGGWRFALVSADAAIPYRTSATAAERYSGTEVARAIELDYAAHGAPLVERLDRAAAHRTPEVLDVFDAHGVLVLNGPPHHPRYYGQLERQNREHRAWLDDIEIRDEAHLADVLDEMGRSLNDLIPRRSLGWCTPTERWNQRSPIQLDRDAFRDEVTECAARIAPRMREEELNLGYHQRFAIEQTLVRHGLLRVTNEERC